MLVSVLSSSISLSKKASNQAAATELIAVGSMKPTIRQNSLNYLVTYEKGTASDAKPNCLSVLHLITHCLSHINTDVFRCLNIAHAY